MPDSLPPLAPRLERVSASVFSRLVSAFGQVEGQTYPLHVGDTWLRPPRGCAPGEQATQGAPHNTYTPVAGLPELHHALCERVRTRTGVAVSSDELFVGAGATACLSAVAGAIVREDDEVLIFAPAWPLFAGMVKTWGGRPIWVPVFGEELSPEALVKRLEQAVTPRTVAVYLNTPNNPTGLVLPEAHLAATAAWARTRGLWIVSDEIYEDFVFKGHHTYMRTLAPERTISAWSFSKGYGMAGYRVGYVAGPAGVVAGARKIATHGWYCAPRPGQLAALHACGDAGAAWVDQARTAYREIGCRVADRLGVAEPEGSTFLFVDLTAHLDDTGLEGLLRDCVREGLLISPGTGFGDYPNHARVCFTAVAPERTLAGVEILARRMGR